MRPIDADALIEFCAERWIPLNIDAVNMQPTIQPEKAQLSQEGTTKDAISRQAAIDALDCINGTEEVLRSLPPAQPEYRLDEWCMDCKEYDQEKHCCPRFNRVIREAAEEVRQNAQPERKKGRWLPDNNSVYEMRFICSECKESEVVPTIGFTKYKPIWDYCPNCGADMRGGQNG